MVDRRPRARDSAEVVPLVLIKARPDCVEHGQRFRSRGDDTSTLRCTKLVVRARPGFHSKEIDITMGATGIGVYTIMRNFCLSRSLPLHAA